MKCIYCNIDNFDEYYGDEDYDLANRISYSNYTSIQMFYSKNNHKFALSASGDDETIFKLNYCPHCGRELGE